MMYPVVVFVATSLLVFAFVRLVFCFLRDTALMQTIKRMEPKARGKVRFIVMIAALLGCLPLISWLVNFIIASAYYGPYLPSGVYVFSEVIEAPTPPPGVPKTVSRQIREFFGVYYRPYKSRHWVGSGMPDPDGTVTLWPNKSVEDTLAEFGGHAENGTLCDANGREIRIVKMSSGKPGAMDKWIEPYRELTKKYVVILTAVREDD